MTLPFMTSTIFVSGRDGWRKFLHLFLDDCLCIHLSAIGIFPQMSPFMYQLYLGHVVILTSTVFNLFFK